MERDSLGKWCKDAGPIGPALWAFDGLVHALAGIGEEDDRAEPQKGDEGAVSLGLILMAAILAAMGIVIALILFFPH